MKEMKVSLKKNKDCKVQMSVEVEAAMVENRYQAVLKDFQRQANLPGFREGKAPVDLVEKRYAEQAKEELLKSLIPEAYHLSVREQKVSPVSLPKISAVKYNRGEKLSFSAEFEEAPSVNVKNYKGIKLKRESAEVPEAEVEKAMQHLRESRAEYSPLIELRPVRQGDGVIVDIEMWHDGHYEPKREGVLLSVEPSDEDDFFAKAVGSNPGDTREVLRAGQPFSRVHIKEVQKRDVPELNEEFAKSLGRDSVEALREAVKKEMSSHKHAQSFEKMKKELFEKLLTMASFPVPETLVEKQTERLMHDTQQHYARMGMPADQWQREEDKLKTDAAARARDQIKLYFILQRISEIEGIEADEAELHARMEAMAKQSQRPLEEVQRVFEDDMRDSFREKKTVDFLIANAKFEEERSSK
jgi:trigger factor